jgi:hypothetical protein
MACQKLNGDGSWGAGGFAAADVVRWAYNLPDADACDNPHPAAPSRL